jgi:hypothetical protein
MIKSLKSVLAVSTVLACVLAAHSANAQNDRIKDINTSGWYQYLGDHYFAPKWSLHTNVQYRRYQMAGKIQQYAARIGLNFDLSPRVICGAGYQHAYSYPYGDYPAADNVPEHRLYQQLVLKGGEGRVAFSHRYRLEQRWVTLPGAARATHTNRMRYQVKAVVPLAGKTIAANTLYLAASDEMMVNFGRQVARNVFDQNRAALSLGYKFSPAAALEAGYLHQLAAQRNGRIFEYNHILQVSYIHNLDWRKKDVPNP